jgi:hypothetical protein
MNRNRQRQSNKFRAAATVAWLEIHCAVGIGCKNRARRPHGGGSSRASQRREALMDASFLLFTSQPPADFQKRWKEGRARDGGEHGSSSGRMGMEGNGGSRAPPGVPAPTVSLHDRTVLRCFAAFFTLSPRDRRNRSTHASLQYCACSPPWPKNKG